jgi:hypothetical protein
MRTALGNRRYYAVSGGPVSVGALFENYLAVRVADNPGSVAHSLVIDGCAHRKYCRDECDNFLLCFDRISFAFEVARPRCAAHRSPCLLPNAVLREGRPGRRRIFCLLKENRRTSVCRWRGD